MRYQRVSVPGTLALQGGSQLFESCEEVKMPAEVAGVMTLRSTFARNGFVSPPTVVDAGYKGKITIALTPFYKAKLRKGTRVVHLVFFRLDEPTKMLYSGKHQGGKIM
ncbi:MAG: hypothetical protein TQ35_0005580 [Candidatus Aramenus sulfurataquae]|jgi:dCTP deaminase|nr:hypothetical protein [Candidatus Aramenus sulfurataquae]